MTSQAKTAKQEPSYLYDSRLGQTIPLTLSKNDREYRVTHTLKPLTNERYFDFAKDLEEVGERVKKLSSFIYEPKDKLWNDLIESVDGYKPRDDWKAGVHISHRTEAVTALIHVLFPEPDEQSGTEADDLWDIDDLTVIHFHAMQAGVLLTDMSHSFRPETKAEMDEFLAIQVNEPTPNKIASAQKLSRAEKLCDLGKKLLIESHGYADGSEIPAWHLAATTESFFARQIAQAKRS